MASPILEISNADVYRGSNKVFDKLSLTISAGENTVILGANGAGKTSLLKLITREIYPVDKEDAYIKLFGESRINLWDLREKIGVVSQDFQTNYLALATGLDVVLSAFFGSIGLHQHHQVSQSQKDRALSIMQTLGIEYLEKQHYLQLSTGQQRRLLLARALIHDPQAFIFDEPTSGLDLKASFQLLKELRQLCSKTKTLVLVTHHISEIIPEIHRVILLKHGKIVGDGNKKEILTDQYISETFDVSVTLNHQNGWYSVAPTESF